MRVGHGADLWLRHPTIGSSLVTGQTEGIKYSQNTAVPNVRLA